MLQIFIYLQIHRFQSIHILLLCFFHIFLVSDPYNFIVALSAFIIGSIRSIQFYFYSA